MDAKDNSSSTHSSLMAPKQQADTAQRSWGTKEWEHAYSQQDSPTKILLWKH